MGGQAWLRRGDGLIGLGEVARHETQSIVEAAQWWRGFVASAEHRSELPEQAGVGPLAFGSFVFDPEHTGEASRLVVPRIVVARRGGASWVTVWEGDGPNTGTEVIAALTRAATADPVSAPVGVSYSDGALTASAWEATVAAAVARIESGEVEKVVLARELVARAEAPLDPRRLIRRLSERYPTTWTYLVDGLVGATPEMLIRREGGLANSRVLAGTIRRTGGAEDELSLARALSHSNKDLAEHEFAVASVAEALAPFSSGMNVPEEPYVLQLPNVMHLASDVTAVTRPGVSSLELAAALHPSAAVCGTPTQVARGLIAELESLDRGRYAGPVGWIDARGDGEWAIALRCGQIRAESPEEIRLYAGCGIVSGSDPRAELAETNAKFVPMREALEG